MKGYIQGDFELTEQRELRETVIKKYNEGTPIKTIISQVYYLNFKWKSKDGKGDCDRFVRKTVYDYLVAKQKENKWIDEALQVAENE